jgi:ParB-like chromosome segregation protein Spo0J
MSGQSSNSARQGLPYHELCEKFFNPIEGPEFDELVADIKANGLRDKIVLHQGKILDGRNRYRACIEAGVFKPSSDSAAHIKDRQHFVVLPSNLDPAAFVFSKNVYRRHLKEDQRAYAAAMLADMRQGERTDREPSANLQKVSQEEAAKVANVSTRSVASATKAIKTAEPDIVEAMKDGKLAVSAAAATADLDPKDQKEVAAFVKEGNKKAAVDKIKKASKRRPKKTTTRSKKQTTEGPPTPADLQVTSGRNLRFAVSMLIEISTGHGLKHNDGCGCSAVPEFLLGVASYEDLKTAYGLLSDVKYAMERKQMAEEARASESVAGTEPASTNAGPTLPAETVALEAA